MYASKFQLRGFSVFRFLVRFLPVFVLAVGGWDTALAWNHQFNVRVHNNAGMQIDFVGQIRFNGGAWSSWFNQLLFNDGYYRGNVGQSATASSAGVFYQGWDSAGAYEVRWQTRPAGSGSYGAFSDPVTLRDQGSGSVTVDVLEVVAAPTEYCGCVEVGNMTATSYHYVAVYDGVEKLREVLQPGSIRMVCVGPLLDSEKQDMTVIESPIEDGSPEVYSLTPAWYVCTSPDYNTPGYTPPVTPTPHDTDPTPIPPPSDPNLPIDFDDAPNDGDTSPSDNGTLKDGFQGLAMQLDALNKNVKSGVGLLDQGLQSIEDGVRGGTNILGTMEGVLRGGTNIMGNLDGRLIGATNLLAAGTNYLYKISTNRQTVVGEGSGVDGKTGSVGDYSGVAGDAEGTAGSGLGSVEAITPIGSKALPTPNLALFTVSFGGDNYDLNPMSQTEVAAAAPWVRGFILFWLCVGTFTWLLKEVLDGVKAAGAFQQTRGVNLGVQVAGTGFQTSWFAAVAASVIAVAALLAVAVYGVSVLADHSWIGSVLAGNPFSGAPESIKLSLWVLDQFFPVAETIAIATLSGVFYVGFTTLLATKSVVIRALPS